MINDIVFPTMRISHADHERFKLGLEKYGAGMTGDEWEDLAKYCGWSVEDVKVYAYRYMHQLFHGIQDERPLNSDYINRDHLDGADVNMENDDIVDGCEKDSSIVGASANSSTSVVDEDVEISVSETKKWTYEECILFDNLLIRYPKNKKDKDMKTRFDKISSMLPSKNAEDCMVHYSRLYVRNETET